MPHGKQETEGILYLMRLLRMSNKILKLGPPEKLDFAKPQEWPDWKQRFERFRCATKLNKEDEVLQINAHTQWGKRQNMY